MTDQALFRLLPEPPSDEEAKKLSLFLDKLLFWNKSYNLTAITERREAVIKHLLDSLVIAPELKKYEGVNSILDVGSGAGLPGIPLSIVLPQFHFTLLDSSGKRVRFMRQMKLELGLDNVEIVQSRVQDFQSEEGFDLITSRAFANGEDMVKWSEHLLAKDGVFGAMKGLYYPEEWENLDHYRVEAVALKVPQLEEERHIIFLERGVER